MSAVRRFTSRTFMALAVRNFRIYFLGQLLSFSGTWMQAVGQGWLVLQLGGSGLALGLVIAVQYVPMLLLGTWGGLVVDRSDKRKVLVATNVGAGLLALALGLIVATGHASMPIVFTLAGLLGIVNLFDNPARQAFVIEMVGRGLLPNAVSLNSVLVNGARAVGPALAALLIATAGVATCFFVNAATYLAALLAIWAIRGAELRRSAPVARERGQAMEGLRYVWATPGLRNPLLALAVVGTFAFNFTTSLPLMARGTFHAGAGTYGAMMAAMGVGAIGGGLYIAWRSRPSHRLIGVLGSAFVVTMVAVALSPSRWLAVAALVPMGACSIAYVSTTNATLQLQSDPQFRGRVMALHAMAFLGSTPIGAPIIGAIAGAVNPRVAVLVGAGMTALATVPLLRQRLPGGLEVAVAEEALAA